MAALWLVDMKTGSMRMLAKAVWLALRAKVTSRFSHSARFGTRLVDEGRCLGQRFAGRFRPLGGQGRRLTRRLNSHCPQKRED